MRGVTVMDGTAAVMFDKYQQYRHQANYGPGGTQVGRRQHKRRH